MKRLLQSMCLLALAGLVAAACGRATPLAPSALPRSPVPTWTLPFAIATPSPVGEPTPAAVTAVPVVAPASVTPLSTPTLSPPTQPPTETPVPLPSPTARPGIDPTLDVSAPDSNTELELPVPEPMPQLHMDKDVINILLLGRDTERKSRAYRTDVIIIVSINKDTDSVTMLTIPRDLFVYIPGWTMNRINTAAAHGDSVGYPGGGVALLEQTILYNLGIPIHGWARVDFQGFKDVVNVIGGVDVPVSCTMQDWRLKDPALDDQDAKNWELYTVETGVQHMDGDLALWYARSRKRSSDFDRSRRQHQVLRAIFDKALRLDMLGKVPELYGQYVQIVDTDLGLGDLLQFVPFAARLDRERIKSRFVSRNEVFPWTTSQGAAVLLPNRDAISALLAEAFLPPPENVLAREATAIEIWNGTPNEANAVLAADNLAWAGLVPVVGQADASTYATTTIYDYTTSAKGSRLKNLQRIFQVKDENVVLMPDAQAAHPYRVVIGSDFQSCVRPQPIIRVTPTPGPGVPTEYVQGENVIHAAPVLEPPPGVDGDLAEWTFLVYPLAQPIFGPEYWQGPDDASAQWNIAWDAEYLYVALNVKDDALAQPSTGASLYQGDSLEIWLDPDRIAGGDFQLGLSPGDLTNPFGVPEAYLWNPKGEARAIPDAVIASRIVPGGYALEVAVPWTVFRYTPRAGDQLGFALALNDDDAPGTAAQQTQLTNRPGQKLTDPTTWGILVLDTPPGP